MTAITKYKWYTIYNNVIYNHYTMKYRKEPLFVWYMGLAPPPTNAK